MTKAAIAKQKDALAALYSLDPGCGRDQWVKLGMASKAAGITFDEFNVWSAQSENYDPRAVKPMWDSLDREGKFTVGAGTLFFEAERVSGNSRKPPSKSRPDSRSRKQEKSGSADSVWAACIPAPLDHAYIKRKGGQPDGVLMYPSSAPELMIANCNVAGWLVVPVRNIQTGKIATLQFVPPDHGKKLNLPGYEVNGAFVVGEMHAASTCFIVEGIGQAWAANAATAQPAAVAFGSGRMEAVAAGLREQYPGISLVLVSDVGKESLCSSIAQRLRCSWVGAPQDLGSNGDINDLQQRDGLSVVASLLAQPAYPSLRFNLLSPNMVLAAPPMQWLVHGVLPTTGLAALYGPSGVGKSFLVLDMVCAIARGNNWFGRATRQAPVVYCALEGVAGLQQRISAYEQNFGSNWGNLHCVTQALDLRNPADIDDLANAILQAGAKDGIVVIDTLHRASPGVDENDSQDMGEVITAVSKLQAIVGGLVLVVHHTGKETNRGMRGHSSLLAALDAAIEVSRAGIGRSWRVAKAKDGRDGDSSAFGLEVITLEENAYGETMTSCVVEPQHKFVGKQPRIGRHQEAALTAIKRLLGDSEFCGLGGAAADQRCIRFDDAKNEVAKVLDIDEKHRKERAGGAIKGLVNMGLLRQNGAWLWCT